jgi:hypothetical protein
MGYDECGHVAEAWNTGGNNQQKVPRPGQRVGVGIAGRLLNELQKDYSKQILWSEVDQDLVVHVSDL